MTVYMNNVSNDIVYKLVMQRFMTEYKHWAINQLQSNKSDSVSTYVAEIRNHRKKRLQNYMSVVLANAGRGDYIKLKYRDRSSRIESYREDSHDFYDLVSFDKFMNDVYIDKTKHFWTFTSEFDGDVPTRIKQEIVTDINKKHSLPVYINDDWKVQENRRHIITERHVFSTIVNTLLVNLQKQKKESEQLHMNPIEIPVNTKRYKDHLTPIPLTSADIVGMILGKANAFGTELTQEDVEKVVYFTQKPNERESTNLLPPNPRQLTKQFNRQQFVQIYDVIIDRIIKTVTEFVGTSADTVVMVAFEDIFYQQESWKDLLKKLDTNDLLEHIRTVFKNDADYKFAIETHQIRQFDPSQAFIMVRW